jgi:hypothetical protein
MSVQIELPAQLLAALRQLTRLENDAEAVQKAASEFVRLSRLRELKAAPGKLEFDANWEQLEQLELGECSPPQ